MLETRDFLGSDRFFEVRNISRLQRARWYMRWRRVSSRQMPSPRPTHCPGRYSRSNDGCGRRRAYGLCLPRSWSAGKRAVGTCREDSAGRRGISQTSKGRVGNPPQVDQPAPHGGELQNRKYAPLKGGMAALKGCATGRAGIVAARRGMNG
jgi:hypothetical protein